MSIKVVNKYKHTPTSNDLYIGRGSKWGNPFTHIPSGTKAKYVVSSREEAIEAYRLWITQGDGVGLLKDLHELQGKNLVCFCKPKSCHGDVLKELADMVVVLPNVGHTVEPKDFQGFSEISISNKELFD